MMETIVKHGGACMHVTGFFAYRDLPCGEASARAFLAQYQSTGVLDFADCLGVYRARIDREDGTAVWCPPSFLPKKSDKPGILFLDEINAAPPLVQAALYQLILDRRVGEYELPEGWRIIAAGNRREDKAVTFRLSSALANRFIHLNLEVDPDDWHAWATNRGIIPEVTAFLKYRPQLLQAASEDEQAFATPRSWEMVSDVVAKFGSPAKARDVIPGIVGTGPAVEFLTFAKKAVLRKEIDAIIADPAGAAIPTELDRLWVLVSFLVAGAQNDGILKIVPTLLPRLPVEFSIVLLRDLIRCRPQIVQEKGVSDFLKTNKVMLF